MNRQRWSAQRLLLMLAACAAATVAVGAACLCVGSTGTGWPAAGVRQFRLEAVMDSALIGAALAAAGVAYQAVLQNPLADPYLLGVSSGASLASYIWRFPMFAALAGMAAASQQGFAFAGAIAAVALVLGLSWRRGRLDPVTLVLVGVIVNAVNGSIFLLLSALRREMPSMQFTFLVGGIQDITSAQRLASLAMIAVGWIVLLAISGPLSAAGLAEAEVRTLGVRIQRLRWTALIAASLVTAAAVAISGPIGFIGLICPHVARLFVGSDQRRLLPVSTAGGAMLLMLADGASRYLAADDRLGTQLQVGVLTGLLGGPFFLWLLVRNRKPKTAAYV